MQSERYERNVWMLFCRLQDFIKFIAVAPGPSWAVRPTGPATSSFRQPSLQQTDLGDASHAPRVDVRTRRRRSVAEALEGERTALPVLVDLHVQLEVGALGELLAHGDARPA